MAPSERCLAEAQGALVTGECRPKGRLERQEKGLLERQARVKPPPCPPLSDGEDRRAVAFTRSLRARVWDTPKRIDQNTQIAELQKKQKPTRASPWSPSSRTWRWTSK